MKILIVEDDDRIAAFLEQGFVKAGFEAKVCSDGLHGLDALLTETPASAAPAVKVGFLFNLC